MTKITLACSHEMLVLDLMACTNAINLCNTAWHSYAYNCFYNCKRVDQHLRVGGLHCIVDYNTSCVGTPILNAIKSIQKHKILILFFYIDLIEFK